MGLPIPDAEFFEIAMREIGAELRQSGSFQLLHLERDRAEAVRARWERLCKAHGRCPDGAYHTVFDGIITHGAR